MAVTISQIEKMKKKFKNLVIEVVATSADETKVEAFTIFYQRNGLRGRLSEGLREVNALWDERQSRPKGYIVVHGSEFKNGECLSIMVSDEFYTVGAKNGGLEKKVEEWISAIKA